MESSSLSALLWGYVGALGAQVIALTTDDIHVEKLGSHSPPLRRRCPLDDGDGRRVDEDGGRGEDQDREENRVHGGRAPSLRRRCTQHGGRRTRTPTRSQRTCQEADFTSEGGLLL